MEPGWGCGVRAWVRLLGFGSVRKACHSSMDFPGVPARVRVKVRVRVNARIRVNVRVRVRVFDV